MDDFTFTFTNNHNGRSFTRGWSNDLDETAFQAIVGAFQAIGANFDNASPEAVAEVIAEAKLGQ